MNEQLSELVAVQLDDGWFLSRRNGDPSNGLMVSEDAVRLINAAVALLLACKTACLIIRNWNCSGVDEHDEVSMAESALVQLETTISIAEGDLPR